ncbi:MAG: 30S ribosomal protein S2, partial [Fusobacteriaceae bacterium]
LTNYKTIKTRIARLKELETMEADGTLDTAYTKKEAANFRKELVKLSKNLSGIKNMPEAPAAIFIVDVKKETLAVEEAALLGIPVFAMIDTNVDPDLITFPIPANDDAIRSVKLISSVMANAIIEGKQGTEVAGAETVNVEEGSAE